MSVVRLLVMGVDARLCLLMIVAMLVRFWSKVQAGPNCWIWMASLDARGYGQISKGSSGAGTAKAHRVSFALANGWLEPEAHVLHRCDNPRCVRPDHLFLGSHAANMLDARVKGRMRHGVRHPFAKLSPEKIRIAREMRASGRTYQEIADHFGVNNSTLYEAVEGVSWRSCASS